VSPYTGKCFNVFCLKRTPQAIEDEDDVIAIDFSKITAVLTIHWEPGSSVSIVSDYELDNRAIGVRSPAGAKDFFSILCVQTGSGAHPASCTMGTEGPFPRVKRGRGVTLTTHPHLLPKSLLSRSYTSSHPSASMARNGTALPLLTMY
jgi:hypothetical protein